MEWKMRQNTYGLESEVLTGPSTQTSRRKVSTFLPMSPSTLRGESKVCGPGETQIYTRTVPSYEVVFTEDGETRTHYVTSRWW